MAFRGSHLLCMGGAWMEQTDVRVVMSLLVCNLSSECCSRYGGSANFKMPSADDADGASSATGTLSRAKHGRNGRASPSGHPPVLNRSELINMNRLIAHKMRDDIEAALEISDDNNMRNLDAAAAR